jgi:hypothetical protein
MRCCSCGALIYRQETLRLLPAARSSYTVVLDDVRQTFLSEIRIPGTGPRGGRANLTVCQGNVPTCALWHKGWPS